MGEIGPSHDCKEILEVYASRPNLRDQPILDPDWVLYTDAVVTEETIVEASSLPSHWSAQWAELDALIRALQLSKGKKTKVYTDSSYAFATLPVHGALHKERGLLTANGNDIKNKEEISILLDAVWEPETVAVMHCWGHQKEDTPQAWGNWLADKAAKHVAEKFGAAGGGSIRTFVLSEMSELTLTLPQYTLAQDQLAEAERATQNEKGWWELLRWQVIGSWGISLYIGVSGSPGNSLGTWQNGRINWKIFLHSMTFLLM